MSSFDIAYNQTRNFEGGYSDHPKDRGGPTIYGISSKNWPNEFATVKALVDQGRKAEAEEYTKNFYNEKFFKPSGAENAPPELQPLIFDAAVNHGVGTAKKILASSGGDPSQFLNQRQAYMDQIVQNDPSQAVFQKGWENRVEAQRDDSLTPQEQAELAQLEAQLGGQSQDDELTPQEQAELAQLEAQSFAPQNDTNIPKTLTPAQEFQNEQPLIRTVGRGGRAVASGLASAADLALLVPKTAAIGIGMGVEAMGAPKIGKAIQNFGMVPTMADTTKALIDQYTGDKLKPTGFWDKTGDFVSETIASAAPFTKGAAFAEKLKQPPNGGNAVSAVLNPQKVAENIFINKYPAPEKITADIVRKSAGEAYKIAEQKGGILAPKAVDSFLDTLQTTVKPKDIIAQALSKNDPANEVMDVLEEMARGKQMSLESLQSIDEVLSNKIDGFIEFGRPKKEGLGLIKIQDALREMVEKAGEGDIVGSKEGFYALAEGRKLWSKAAKLRDVERIVTRAEMSQQPANAMKAGFRTLYNNPNRMRGFSKQEQAAIKKAAETGIVGELLSGVGSRLTGIGASLVGGPQGYVIGKGAEMSARGMGSALQAKRAQALANMIAKPTPTTSQPLLTQQGAATALGLANALGQKLLPAPQPQIPSYLMNTSKALQGVKNGI
jgi:hypothetical protein